jgi:hypothetical protein
MGQSIIGKFSGTTYTAQWIALPSTKPDGVWGYEGPDGSVDCWSYGDERGRGPSIGAASDRHATAEAALVVAAERDVIRAAYGGPLTREEYEAEAARLGVELFDERMCATCRGDWDLRTYGVLGVAGRTLMERRGSGIEAATPKPSAEEIAAQEARADLAFAIANLEDRAQDAEDRENLTLASKLRAQARALRAKVAV